MKNLLLILVLVCLTSSACLAEGQKAKINSKKMYENLIYPQEAIDNSLTGKVYVKVYVNKKGELDSCHIMQADYELFGEPALTAIKKAGFIPAEQNGKKVYSEGVIVIEFLLNEEGEQIYPWEDEGEEYSEFDEADHLESSRTDEAPEDLLPPRDMAIPVDKLAKPDLNSLMKNFILPDGEIPDISYSVQISVWIDENGKPLAPEIIESNYEPLDQSAIDAVMAAAYTPAMKDGKPLGVWIIIPMQFDLRNK